jgi:hypothetical protein
MSTEGHDVPPQPPERPGRPWFGPKRVGYGVRPQTWQGWAVVMVPAVIAVVVALLLAR